MKIFSKLRIFQITIQKYIDHIYRYVSGIPQLKRSLITKDIILGGQYSLRALPKLKKLGVTGIVNMRMHSIHKESIVNGYNILNLPTPDRHAPKIEQLKRGVEFIRNEINKGGKVYIHCRQGEGRGPTMALAYLISTGITLEDALKYVREVRTFISPTRKQLDRLKEFEKHVS